MQSATPGFARKSNGNSSLIRASKPETENLCGNRRRLLRNGRFAAAPKNRFRVLHEIVDAERRVLILAIGEKEGNRLFVGEEEIERLLITYSPRLREVLDASREQFSAGKGIAHNEFWAAVDSESNPKAQKPRGTSRARARIRIVSLRAQ